MSYPALPIVSRLGSPWGFRSTHSPDDVTNPSAAAYHFSLENPNVVHMSIRPQDLDEEEPKAGGKNPSAGNGDGQRQRSGGCCVVL